MPFADIPDTMFSDVAPHIVLVTYSRDHIEQREHHSGVSVVPQQYTSDVIGGWMV